MTSQHGPRRAPRGGKRPIEVRGRRVTRFAHLTDLHFTTRKQNRYPTSHAHIRRLRAKVEDDADDPKRIQTVHGVGYIYDTASDAKTAD